MTSQTDFCLWWFWGWSFCLLLEAFLCFCVIISTLKQLSYLFLRFNSLCYFYFLFFCCWCGLDVIGYWAGTVKWWFLFFVSLSFSLTFAFFCVRSTENNYFSFGRRFIRLLVGICWSGKTNQWLFVWTKLRHILSIMCWSFSHFGCTCFSYTKLWGYVLRNRTAPWAIFENSDDSQFLCKHHCL